MSLPYAEVIGDPIAQSKSPLIHKHWLSALGLEGDYRRAHITAEALPAYIATRRQDADWRGCNVTMPHKQAVMPLLDALNPLAERVGAVNTVVRDEDGRLTGYNTDVPGFMEPLAHFVTTLDQPCRALVLGNGGAARAVVAALAEAGPAITLAARDPAKARALVDALAPVGDHGVSDLASFAQPAEGGYHLLINASPLGMVGNPPLSFDLSHLAPGALVYDIVTAPLHTPLLQAAEAEGFATVDGLAMLIGQAAYAFQRFFGAAPPRQDGDAALRALLTV